MQTLRMAWELGPALASPSVDAGRQALWQLQRGPAGRAHTTPNSSRHPRSALRRAGVRYASRRLP